ncbi:uncharacterized protein TNCT_733291 [Trichonephila clavata]|uniref:Uncharacterized protein n=1 Tax=Trichonephila clavata TaxID=2740835 RepID=A0A8X6GS00_TRICU|nr:uncharacterized protein TNCT_733291 [Trichonephila clavata]
MDKASKKFKKDKVTYKCRFFCRPGHIRLLSSVLWALATMMFQRGVRPCSSSALRRRSVVLLLLCVVMVTGEMLKNDPNCLKLGGLCLDQESCPVNARVSDQGLCQLDDKPGVCCFTTPENADCQQRGGRCGTDTECSNVQNFGQLDCSEGTRCCLLIY